MTPEELTVEQHHGIAEIASKVRRQPRWILSVLVSSLVHEASERWRETQDLLEVTDEVPVTAWVVRRKSDLLLPGEVSEEEALPEGSTDVAPWIPSAIEQLRRLQENASHCHARSPRLDPMPPAPVKGASPWKLSWSWPKLKAPKSVAPHVIRPEADPVRERLAKIRRRLDAAPYHGIEFNDLIDSPHPTDRIMTLLALTQLWHVNELTLEQTQAFGPIWVRRERTPG